MDRVRVIRIYEFTGPRDIVEKQIARSLHGERDHGNGCVIRGTTLGGYPEVIGGYIRSLPKPSFWQRVIWRLDNLAEIMNRRQHGA